MLLTQTKRVREIVAGQLAKFAVEALLEEVGLTPKPGLVDRANTGSHDDLTLELMQRSAYALEETFFEMAMVSFGKAPSSLLRERLAAIGRHGEEQMLRATGGINTHKGAIWVLGLLTAAIAGLHGADKEGLHGADKEELHGGNQLAIHTEVNDLLITAGAIAGFEDRFRPVQKTNGDAVRSRYRVRSAREEAIAGFPSLRLTALPAWERFREKTDTIRKGNVLLALMSVVDDTCILHRSNMDVLRTVQQKAGDLLREGGMGLAATFAGYRSLDQYITGHRVSPGGSADLLAATIFLQKTIHSYKIN